MASVDERSALIAVTCPHCSAAPGELCFTLRRAHGRDVRVPITTLDGGAHDARWLVALGRPAAVVRERVSA
jgi:hypothetical protein